MSEGKKYAVTRHGKGSSFWGSNERWYMTRCHKCGVEMYAPNVPGGICPCGYDVNKDTTVDKPVAITPEP